MCEGVGSVGKVNIFFSREEVLGQFVHDYFRCRLVENSILVPQPAHPRHNCPQNLRGAVCSRSFCRISKSDPPAVLRDADGFCYHSCITIMDLPSSMQFALLGLLQEKRFRTSQLFRIFADYKSRRKVRLCTCSFPSEP